VHPTEARFPTVLERRRLQSIPDDVLITGRVLLEKDRMVGNAVSDNLRLGGFQTRVF
jgi:site-specific DNA-cytosine methylase